jgi:hypothetical protein
MTNQFHVTDRPSLRMLLWKLLALTFLCGPSAGLFAGAVLSDGLTWHSALNGMITGAVVAMVIFAARLPAYRR